MTMTSKTPGQSEHKEDKGKQSTADMRQENAHKSGQRSHNKDATPDHSKTTRSQGEQDSNKQGEGASEEKHHTRDHDKKTA